MERRDLLRYTFAFSGTGLTVGTVGCISKENDSETPTATPSETASSATEVKSIPEVGGHWPLARFDGTNSGNVPGSTGPRSGPSTSVFKRLDSRPVGYLTAAGPYLFAKQGSSVECYSLEDGTTVWEGGTVTNGLEAGGQYLTPVVHRNLVFTADSLSGGRAATIGAASASDGRHVWEYEFAEDNVTPHSTGARGNRVYLLANQGKLFSFTADGKRVWWRDVEGITGEYDTLQAPVSIAGDRVVVLGNNGILYVFRASDGETVYERDIIDLHLGQRQDRLETRARFANDADGGVERYRDEGTGGVALADGTAFVVTLPSGRASPLVHAIDLDEGEVQWETGLFGDIGYQTVRDWLPSAAVVDEDKVYVMSKTDIGGDEPSRTDNLFAMSRSDGTIQWSRAVGYNGTTLSPAVAGGTLYAVSTTYDGDEASANLVVALATETGETRWTREVDGNVKTDPLVVGESVLVATRARGLGATNRIHRFSG